MIFKSIDQIKNEAEHNPGGHLLHPTTTAVFSQITEEAERVVKQTTDVSSVRQSTGSPRKPVNLTCVRQRGDSNLPPTAGREWYVPLLNHYDSRKERTTSAFHTKTNPSLHWFVCSGNVMV